MRIVNEEREGWQTQVESQAERCPKGDASPKAKRRDGLQGTRAGPNACPVSQIKRMTQDSRRSRGGERVDAKVLVANGGERGQCGGNTSRTKRLQCCVTGGRLLLCLVGAMFRVRSNSRDSSRFLYCPIGVRGELSIPSKNHQASS